MLSGRLGYFELSGVRNTVFGGSGTCRKAHTFTNALTSVLQAPAKTQTLNPLAHHVFYPIFMMWNKSGKADGALHRHVST